VAATCLYAIAGVPDRTFNEVRNGLYSRGSRQDDYVSVAFPRYTYKQSNLEALQRAAISLINGARSYNRFFLLFIPVENSSDLISSAFGNSCFPIPVDFSPPSSVGTEGRMKQNSEFAISRFLQAVQWTKKERSIDSLANSIEKWKATPWVLPGQNFHSPSTKEPFQNDLRNFQSNLQEWEKIKHNLTRVKFNAEQLPRCGMKRVKAYVDSRNIVFCPSESAVMHGELREHGNTMKEMCHWLEGRFRFGMALPIGAHFDCQREHDKKLGIDFICNLHGPVKTSASTHANIYPNDFVRA
jgi:hypothetical protein